jgi:DNA sulfur modification protein DndC
MKIKPSREKIDKITEQHGSAILLLGSRVTESSSRSRSMQGRAKNARRLNAHHEIPNAFVFAPISDWETDDVWEYLFENDPPPWGRPHADLLDLYRQAHGGECPVVMDLNTPSCGGSRFGCWVCTVVKDDKSMEGFLTTGEEWMRPLNEFRNWLKEIREDPNWRMSKRRTGQEGPGPFTPSSRQKILYYLFETEKRVGIQLIRDVEIDVIQEEWARDFDLQKSAYRTAHQFGRSAGKYQMKKHADDEEQMIEDVAVENGINSEVLSGLLALEEEFPDLHAWGMRPQLRRRIEDILSTAAKKVENADPQSEKYK